LSKSRVKVRQLALIATRVGGIPGFTTPEENILLVDEGGPLFFVQRDKPSLCCWTRTATFSDNPM